MWGLMKALHEVRQHNRMQIPKGLSTAWILSYRVEQRWWGVSCASFIWPMSSSNFQAQGGVL